MPIDPPQVAEPETADGTPGDDPPAAPEAGVPPPGGTPPDAPVPDRGRPRGRRVLAGVVALGLVLGSLGVWLIWSPDLPSLPTPGGTTRVTYTDNSVLASFSAENRVPVTLEQVPVHLRRAVLAAEDPDFGKARGNVVTATGRALRSLVSGSRGGASLTEQYVRMALPHSDDGRRSAARTVVLAHKLEGSMSSDDILLAYLNTAYFGRGSFGVQTAARAYFGKDVRDLNVEESAVLAALIGDPTHRDPSKDAAAARRRWNTVLDGMVTAGWLEAGQRTRMTYPSVRTGAARQNAWRQGWSGVLGQKIESELEKLGFSPREIATAGLTVRTTIDRTTQVRAAEAARTRLDAARTDPRQAAAVVSIEPATGAVRAYYGGDQGYGTVDLASSAGAHPAAATFEPFVLATAVEERYGIDSRWNGTSGQVFEDRPDRLENSGKDSSCGPKCSLTDATIASTGTVFWAASLTVGHRRVAATASKAGIGTVDGRSTDTATVDGTLALGRPRVSVFDQATAYTTIANYGATQEPYLVAQVVDGDGKTVLWDRASQATPSQRAWSPATGRDVSYVLQRSYAAEPGLGLGRPAAAKSGGQRHGTSSDSWVVGYTPQLVTAVWTGTGDGPPIPAAEQRNGAIDVRGAGVPGAIWRDVMTSAHRNLPVRGFPAPVHSGDRPGNAR